MALYLKYRPKDFESLVGQDFVKDTLQKAVEADKTVGAYLFCGPRGTGKTSTARIFAKAVNCEKPKKGNPCNNCDICKAINSESLVDVIEIDAASHTGVDNIREIIEKAQFRPTSAKYKIYIIDEVHMLSKGAFNALLKILEEPPVYVKFILATTETHKVPETIISRCQRYDMKSISLDDIRSRLSFIATQENISIDTQSLEYIAQNAGGALRNAISLFEQLNVGGKITFSELIKNLGIVKEDVLSNFLDKLIGEDKSVVENFDELITDGKNIKLFFRELLFYTKKVSLDVLKAGKDISKYLQILEILDNTYSKTKVSLDENTTFLIGILKIINGSNDTASIEEKKAIPKNVVSKEHKEESTIKKNSEESSEKMKTQEMKEEISSGDIDDIFGSKTSKEPLLPETQLSKDSDEFNSDAYLTALKKAGAKAMVTLSIKGATISLVGKVLELKFKTKFALNSINNTDTISLLNKGLIDMGMSDVTVKLIG